MDATLYEFKTCPWPPPEDRRDGRFYLFGFDADNQPHIVRWCERKGWCGWLAISLNDEPHNTAEPIVHAIEGENSDRLRTWADAPLRWSTLEADTASATPDGGKMP